MVTSGIFWPASMVGISSFMGLPSLEKLCGEKMMIGVYTAACDDASPTKRLGSHARFD